MEVVGFEFFFSISIFEICRYKKASNYKVCNLLAISERETGVEPATLSLGSVKINFILFICVFVFILLIIDIQYFNGANAKNNFV